MKTPKCKHCGAENQHYSTFCMKAPKKAIKASVTQLKRTPLPRPTKPIKKKGKVSKQWERTRAKWFLTHSQVYYACYICGKRMNPSETQLDHVKSRSSRPDLRFSLDNLKPICMADNMRKGSLSLDKYLETRGK